MDRTITIKNKRSNTSHLKLSKMFDSKTLIFMIIGFSGAAKLNGIVEKAKKKDYTFYTFLQAKNM